MNTVNISNCPYDLATDTLKTGSIFGALCPSAIEFLLQEGELLHYVANEKVFSDNDKGDSFYIVIEGEVSYFKEYAAHSNLIRHVCFGEALGYVTMISLAPRLGYAVAKTDTLLLQIDYTVFGNFHERFAFDFGILILNLSRDMARNIKKLSTTLTLANLDVDLTR